MELEGRRMRRFGIRRYRRQTQNLLPLQDSTSDDLSKAISCWYCDYKISSLNRPLFYFGRRHARFLKGWFSIGVGFALSALLGVTLVLLWKTAMALHLCCGKNYLGNLKHSLLFGFSPLLSSLSLSPAGAGYMCISTFISVFVHEFGHAVAAASEGIQIEYIAVFIAVLFPGALVAFDYELLQTLPHFAALRVYSAGIWHNAVCSAGCGLALFALPWILFPFYAHGHGPMVLDVSPTSPLSAYLAPGDVILSVDDIPVRTSQEWMELNTLVYNMKLNNVNFPQQARDSMEVNVRKGYCVPNVMMEESKLVEKQYVCPNDFNAFVEVLCSPAKTVDHDHGGIDFLSMGSSVYCVNAKEIAKSKKCGDNWGVATSGRSGCTCSQIESCLYPVQEPGLVWVEITFSNLYSHECSPRRNSSQVLEISDLKTKCGGTFIFVGDAISMAHSVLLTSYQPRWRLKLIAKFPNLLEQLLIWTFHVSLALALLNSLPVYFLDGGSLLEAILCHCTPLSSRKREKVLRLCLFAGTLISVIAIFQDLL